MLQAFKNGQGSIILRVKLLNSSVSTGAGLTGLTSASAGLIISTIADNEATATAYTQAGSTIETITTLGTYAAPTATKCRFKEVDATNHKGVYEIQIADARFAVASAKSLIVSWSGATNLAEGDALVTLQSFDPYDAVRAGLTALPNAAAEAAGGLYTRGTGAGQIAQDANGNVRVNLDTIKTNPVVNAGTVTFPTNATLASTTNITAGTITTVTTVTGLTASNLDATVSSRMATYTQPTGFLTATFPAAVGDATAANQVTINANVLTRAIPGDAMALTAGERTTLTAAIWAFVVTGTTTAVQAMRGFIAAMLGKASGLDLNAPKYRNIADTKDVISATTDVNGNRTVVTLDLT